MINWYDPNQIRTAGKSPPQAAPSPVPSADKNKTQYISNNGGGITDAQLADPQWGAGITFQLAAKQGQINALKNAMSSANPEDYAAMDELRNYYRGKLGDLPTNEANRVTSFDTQSQRGLANLLSQQKIASAGTGTGSGTRQFAGAQGDIVSRLTSDYMAGLGNEKARSLQDANAIQGGLSGVQNQNLAERQFQFNQGQGLASVLGSQIAQDQGRESSLAGSGGGGNWMADVLPAVGTIAGAALGGPAGAMIGGSIGSAAGGAAGGRTAGSNTSGMQLAQVLQNQQMMQNYGQPVAPSAPSNSGYMSYNNYGGMTPTIGRSAGYY